MKDNFCYFNGDIIRFNEIVISPYDLGFVRGYGIFDAMRTANGIPFCFNEHWSKLELSAKNLGLRIPVSKLEFKEIINILFKKNNFKEMAIKTVLTGGESENGFTRANMPTFMIIVDELDKFCASQDLYKFGCKVIFCEYQRFLPEIKTLNYLEPLRIQVQRDKENAQEILYKKDGNVLECSTSNIFMVKDGKLITPLKDVFLGTMRNLIIEIAKKNDIQVEEREISLVEFLEADEIFLAATYKKIIPVTNIDGNILRGKVIGKTTTKLMRLVNEFIESYA